MTIVTAGLIVALVVLVVVVRLFARWEDGRDDRRRQMLEESWAIYRASRQIHDQTTAALQEMLDAARSRNSEPS